MTGRSDLELHVASTADSRGLKKAADDLDHTTKSSDKMGESFHETGEESGHLDKRIKELEGHITELGHEFDRTGNKDALKRIRTDRGELSHLKKIQAEIGHVADATNRTSGRSIRDMRGLGEEIHRLEQTVVSLDRAFLVSGDRRLLGGLQSARGDLNNLRQIRKELEGLKDTGDAALKGFGQALGAIPSAMMPAIIASVVEAAVIAGPALGAAVAGAVVGAGGTLGVIGGVVAAAQSQEVKDAFASMGRDVSAEFAEAGRGLVPEVIHDISELKAAFNQLDLAHTFELAGPSIHFVIDGIGRLVNNFMPGFNRMLERAEPFAQVFANGMGDLGTALGNFLDYVSRSPGALAGLQGLFDFLAATISGAGHVLEWFSDRYIEMLHAVADTSSFLEKAAHLLGMDGLAQDFANVNHFAQDFIDRLPKAADATALFSGGMRDSARYTQGLADALKNANKAFDEFFQKNMSVDQARLSVQMGLLELQKQLKDTKNDWSKNTEEGLRNREMLLQQVQKLQQLRDASIAAGDGSQASVDKANRAYDKAIKKLEALAKQAGLDKASLEDLAGTYTVTFFLQQKAGAEVVAWSTLRNAERQQDAAKNQKANAPVTIYGGGKATGGPVMAGVAYTINERQRETVTFPANGVVHPASLAPAAGAQMSARPVQFAGGGMGEIFWSWFVNEVQRRGGTLAVLGIRET